MHALAFTRGAPGKEERDGVHLERLRPRWRISNTPLDPTFQAQVGRALDRVKPDVVLAHTPVPFPAEMAFLAARSARVPFVLTYHAGRLEGGSPLLDVLAALDRATLERTMLAGADGLVAVGPYVRDHALGAHRDRVHIVPPGVDAARFQPAPPPRGQDILFVAPLDGAYRWKGLDTLWAALPLVRKHLPAARLVLVGDGDRAPDLRARAQAEGLGQAVVFRGRVAPEDLVHCYQEAAVACLPSTSPAESFGMVLAEANACARPVVASRVGGIPDFVRDGENGLLVRPRDPGALAEALLRVLTQPGLAERLGQAGRARVVRDHDWDRAAERTELVLAGAARKPMAARRSLGVTAG